MKYRAKKKYKNIFPDCKTSNFEKWKKKSEYSPGVSILQSFQIDRNLRYDYVFLTFVAIKLHDVCSYDISISYSLQK